MLQQQDELMKTIREIDAQHEAEEEEASWGALDVIAVAETKKSADLETLRGLLDQLQQVGKFQSPPIAPIAAPPRVCSFSRMRRTEPWLKLRICVFDCAAWPCRINNT